MLSRATTGCNRGPKSSRPAHIARCDQRSKQPGAKPAVLLNRARRLFFVCKILIVDDDDDLRDVLHVFLSDCGHDVHESSDGQEALAWLSRHRDALPCVAIVDLRMPAVDGWDLLATVRRDPLWRKLPVVVLSGTIQRGEYLPVLQADRFLAKPVQPPRLEPGPQTCTPR